jgi:amino acid adenylation domain-containing protein
VTTQRAKYELTVGVREEDGKLKLGVEYDGSIYDEETVARMMRHYKQLLEEAVKDTGREVREMGMMSEGEKEQVERWNATGRDYDLTASLHTLFEAQTELTPQATALICDQQRVTYSELNLRANQLARHLSHLGVRQGAIVAICAERSVELVVGLLAILKAGAAYLPLDPSYPEKRLAFMLEDAQATALLIQPHFLEASADREPSLASKRIKIVPLDSNWKSISQYDGENLNLDIGEESLAYLIYTSGSTGTPKGVMVPHRGICNRVLWMQEAYQLTADDRVLQKTPYTFDVSVWEFFWPLISGACLVIARPDGHRDTDYLVDVITTHQVTTVHFVPSMLSMFLEAKSVESCSSLKRVIASGEALTHGLQERFHKRMDAQLHNLYGPTEASVDVSYWACQRERESKHQRVPIGRPIANTQLYVMDESLNMVWLGVWGELYIGGVALARGYNNRPDMTAESFIPDPYAKQGGSRLYKTGDVARYLADGNLEYQGRTDHQVKIRGLRIELGEIEATLKLYPLVRDCVVVAREDNPGDKRLVGYVVTGEHRDLESELRSHLKERLPDYMVPAAIVEMEALPLTSSGKIDRRALPEPTHCHEASDEQEPRTPIEEVLVELWQEVLTVEQVRRHDNFFDLGGHSLLATLLASRAGQAFQVDVPVQAVFEAPTIAQLAGIIETIMLDGSGLRYPPIVAVSREEHPPLSFAQQRLWFINQLEPDNSFYNIPVAILFNGPLSVAAFEQSINEIVRRHDILRTSFVVVDGAPIQLIAPSLTITMPTIDLRETGEEERRAEVKRLINEEAHTSFELSVGPLMRVSLVRTGDQEGVLLLTMHHIISDAWSMKVFIQELKVLYVAFTSGRSASLPDLKIQYADFARWQRSWLQGDVLEAHLDYWRQQLHSMPALIELPLDRPRPAVQTFRGARETVMLPAALTKSLRDLSRAEGVTLFMTLLAAFQTLLYRYKAQDHIGVGTDVANRNHTEIESLIGFFVNLLPLCADMRGNPTFQELLERVRKVTLGAYTHQDLPFDKLVEDLQPERHTSYAPLIQVLLVLQNVPIPAMELSGVSLKSMDFESKSSKFDLAMILQEVPDQGIIGNLMYNTDIFNASTIRQMIGRFETLLGSIVEQPAATLNDLEVLTEAETLKQTMERKERKESDLEVLLNVQPKVISLSTEALVKINYLDADKTLPLVITPAEKDLDIADWASNNRDFIEKELLKHGGILFRGFGVKSVPAFEHFAQVICSELFDEYGDLRRESVEGKVYTSTPYPADQSILLHNESSQVHQWPMKICFYCITPAQQGGETPIVDCRTVYQALDPDIREGFARKGLMYVRNFIDGLDVSWQEFFRTEDKAAVEEYCRNAAIETEWKADGSLRTRKIGPAVAKHPRTGETVFFNQLQAHHSSCLSPAVLESLLSLFSFEDLPRNVYYGDGSRIDDAVVDEVREVYRKTTTSFPWQTGDILVLDNMLTAHGRNAFAGSRKIVVAMGEMIRSKDVQRVAD